MHASRAWLGLPNGLPEAATAPLFDCLSPISKNRAGGGTGLLDVSMVIAAPRRGMPARMVCRAFHARFFVATFFCTSRQVVWKGATASVPPKGCKNKCGPCLPAHTLVWGGPSAWSRWCEWQRVGGAGAGLLERADRSLGPHQRGCRAPFPSERSSDVAPVMGPSENVPLL